MGEWTLLDYIEPNGRNPIREWLDSLPPPDQARIDDRLLMMEAMPKWPEKWASKYRGREELYEFRIKGNKVQYRPLGTYWGKRQYVLLAGAVERNWKIPRTTLDVADRRLARLRSGVASVKLHEFDRGDDE